MIGNLISGAAAIAGGLFGKSSADKANEQNLMIARENQAMQREFAQNGIRWKVEDAKAAGIHPVYAMGAPTTSFSPISFNAAADDSMSKAFASAGQDIGSAINKTRTAPERADAYSKAVQTLTLEKGALENEVLRSQLKRIQQQNSPPMPGQAVVANDPAPFAVPENKKPEERPPLMMMGGRWLTNPNTSPMKAWEDQYGDDGWASWVLPPVLATNDLGYNIYRRWPKAGQRSWLPSQRALANPSRGY